MDEAIEYPDGSVYIPGRYGASITMELGNPAEILKELGYAPARYFDPEYFPGAKEVWLKS